MKTMRLSILFALLIIASGIKMQAENYYDFSAMCSSGQTLYYKITDASNRKVILTSPNDPDNVDWWDEMWKYYAKPQGNIVFPESVSYNNLSYSVVGIDDYAFGGCVMSSVTIPKSITNIPSTAFVFCDNLVSITVANSNPVYDSRNSCNAIIKTNTNELVCGCKSTVIPNGITAICDRAFFGVLGEFSSESFSITIPSSVVTIGEDAFCYCNVSVTVGSPSSLVSVGESAFFCNNANTITFNSLELPNIESIGRNAFQACSINSVSFGNSLTTIGEGAFVGSSISGQLVIPNSVITIGNQAFGSCSNLTSINLSNANSLTSIGPGAFNGCLGVTGTITIPNSVVTIGSAAFWECRGISTIIIGNGVTSIGSAAFYNCISLSEITIGSSVNSIDGLAFYYGSNTLHSTNITVLALNPPTLGNNSFYGRSSDSVFVPCGTTSNYQYRWGSVFNSISENGPCPSVITVSANPTSGGIVSGAGTYLDGTNCTLTATPNAGYGFSKWTKNGTQVSTNPTYTFTVNGDATYVANFVQAYTITASSNPSAGGSVSGGGTYNNGSTCTLTATPASGYAFTKWTKNGTQVSTNPTYTFTVSSTNSGSYVAYFVRTYTITVTANPTSGGSVTGGGTYNSGASCTLTATPATGYNFTKWTKNSTQVSTSTSYTFTVNGAATYVAQFTKKTYSIVATANPTAGGSITGAGTYEHGASCTLVATPATGYHFVNWTQNGTQVSTNASYQFTVTGGKTLVANFAPNTYAVTLNTNDGTINSGNVTSYTYGEGATLPTDVTRTGYTFGGWYANANLTGTAVTSISTTATGDKTFWAKWTINSYAIGASANPTAGGTVSGAGSYNYGASCTLTATPATGYTFVNWTENGTAVSTDAAYSFMVTGPRTLVANFCLNSYNVTVAADPTTGGTITGAGTYSHGANVTLTATTNTGYTFVNWTRDGVEVSTSPAYSFTVTGPGNYAAHFSLNSYEVLTGADPEAGGTVTGGGTYNYGETATLTATANEGYTFDHWSDGYASEYFTIESLEDGNTITLTIGAPVTQAQMQSISYSTDDGATWNTTTIDDTEQLISVGLDAGEKALWKGTGTNLATGFSNISKFSSTKNYVIYGNLLSLLWGEDFGSKDYVAATYTFTGLFFNSTSLIDAKNLCIPIKDLDKKAMFADMFRGCSNLVHPPMLSPVTISGQWACMRMFQNCSSLVSTFNLDDLTAIGPSGSVLYQAFLNCTSLVNAPKKLKPLTLTAYCYGEMFKGCSSLTVAPELPATTVSNYCYQSMFNGCTSLTQVPAILPALELQSYCYSQMFRGCTALNASPILPAPVLVERCYEYMFNGDSSLNKVTCLATDISASDPVVSWMTNVGQGGTFYKHPSMTAWPQPSGTGIPGTWTVEDITTDYQTPYEEQYFTIESLEDGNTITLTIPAVITTSYMTSVSYSTDNGATWNTTEIDGTAKTITVSLANSGDKALFKGIGRTLTYGNSHDTQQTYFSGSKQYIVYGNIASLLYGDDFEDKTQFPDNSARTYQGLFAYSDELISAQNLVLPYTILAGHCYRDMFTSCDGLTQAPQLPATTLNNDCYMNMFSWCTALTHAPELPATTLVPECYNQMFRGCSSLTHAPELPAQTLAYMCYYLMFHSCSSLAQAPNLPAATLVSKCYQSMFYGCSSLNEVTCLATDISATDCTASWLNGVASTGTFHKASGMNNWPAGVSGIPSGWTVFEEAPADPTEPSFSYTVTGDRYWLANFTLNSYEINASASPVEGGTVTGTGTYNHFDNCTLMANANAGYTFVNWTENDNPVSTDVAYSFTVTGPRTLSANFSLNSYSITVAADPVEGGTITGAGTYAHGANVTLTATANTGYTFVNWTKDGIQVSTSPTYSFSVTEPGAYAAHFSLNSYEVLTGTDPEAGGTVTGGGTYDYGETATLTATANKGYTFDHWSDGYASEYFTIESLEDGNTITLTIGSAVTSAHLTYVAWSKDKTNWTSTTVDDTEQVISVPANAHEKVYWKGEGTTYATSGDNSTGQSIFSTSKAFDVSGNIMSLLYGDDFVGQTSLPNNTRTFANLLSQNLCLINAKHLKLPATTMAQNCYQYLFSGCSALTTVPELPATELTVCCYQYMFMGCVSLTNAPELPASTMKTYCYRGMFRDCTSLTKAPALPATIVAQSCYEAMFYGCSSLGETPALPATVLANACYKDMFYGCTSLTTAPALPANDLTFRCYRAMFKGCSSLTKAPALPAAVLMDECYNQMFTNCSLLNEVTCLATDISATDCLTNWLGNVASTGTFHKAADMTGWTTGASGIPTGWTLEDITTDYQTPFEEQYFTIESLEDGNTITLTIGSAVTQAQMQNISYSTDNGATWSTTTVDDTEQVINVSLNAGEKVLWKGTGVCTASSYTDATKWSVFSGTKPHKVYGNIGSLLFGDDFEGVTALPATPNYGRSFQRLFNGNTCLTDAGNLILPFTTIQSECYGNMFHGCASLASVPELPALEMKSYSYQYMFYGCSSLLKAPALPATTLAQYCYQNMFYGCTSLTEAPSLPATALAQYCYRGMFNSCTSLISAPELPAHTLAENCYQTMFKGCSSLIKVPSLPATTLVSTCYSGMFWDCTSLNEVTCLATDISATNCTLQWLQNVASTGTFHKASCMNDWPTGVSGIPNGWTVFEEAPVDPTEPSFSYTVTEDRYWLAHFTLNSYEINASVSPMEGGAITGEGTYNHFESCTLTATANEGYTFVNWTENDAEVSTDATYIFTVTGPRTLVANFSLNNYDITVEANPAEGGTATGAGNYDHGTTATLGATANTGYHFVNWTKNGNEVSTDNPFDLIVTVAGNYVANFALNTYEVTATADPTEGGTITGTGVYDHGTTATLTATPAQGYAFSHWTNDYESEYFTIESLGDNNTITLTIPSGVTSEEMTSVSYSFDKTTWTTTTIDDDDQTISVTLNANEKVYWKGIGSTMAIGTDEDSHSSFLSDGTFKVYGNAMSLFHGDDFVGKTNDNDYYMAGLFYGSEVVDAFNLALPITTANSCYRNLFYGCSELESAPLLPATALSEYCYAYMFKNCTSLVKSPTLPAATLDRNSYYQMFYGCSALNEVTCLATDISASNCTKNWLSNVSSAGTFHKASGMTGWTAGTSGIPSGWTASDGTASAATVSFTVTEPTHYTAHFTPILYPQEVTLDEGWNWWAPTVAATLQDLETALGANGLNIKAEDGSALSYANGQWSGTLQSLALGQMYRVKTSAPCEFTLNGTKPASVTVSLAPGSYWFGYTGDAATAIADVFGTAFGPAEGDKVVSQTGGFAIFNGTAWEGTLTTLQPGMGYVYVSQAQTTKTVTF